MKKIVDSCVACGKVGHLASKVVVPGYVDRIDGTSWDYKCPLAVSPKGYKKLATATSVPRLEAYLFGHRTVTS